MSRLEELIEKLCPDGVEYKTIEEVCINVFSGGTPKTSTKEYYDGDIPWLRSGEVNFNEITRTEKFITEKGLSASSAKWIRSNSVLIALTGATVARSAVNVIPVTANQSVCAMETDDDIINYKFLYYCIENMYRVIKGQAQGALTSINLSIVKKITVPVPPLEVQEEIVKLLDNFTELTAELTEKLTAELTARKKQYEYYRDELLTSDNSTDQFRLGEICDIYLGLTATPTYTDSGVKFISAQNTSGDYLDLENDKYISRQDFEKATSNAKPKKGDLLFTRVGSNLGHPVIVDTDEDLCIFVSLGFLRVKDKQTVLTPFLKYWMNTDMFWSQVRKNVHGAAKVNLNTGWLKDFEIAIPSLEEQQRIVDILDRFDKLCNDISEGLPAEIEARQKQYEYYRDKLLTFKEKAI